MDTLFTVDKSRAYGISFLLAGVLGLGLVPTIMSEWGSPLYTIAAIILSLFSVMYGYIQGFTEEELHSSRSIATIIFVTGSVYFTSVTFEFIRKPLIEIVAKHVHSILSRWYEVELTAGPIYGYTSELVFVNADPVLITYIDIACTGIGSLALVYGIISIFNSSRSHKVMSYILSAVVIYILNIGRNVFIAVAFAEQWFAGIPMSGVLFGGAESAELTSFVIAETVISQSISALLLFIGLFIVFEYTSLLTEVFTDLDQDIATISSKIRSILEGLNQRNGK